MEKRKISKLRWFLLIAPLIILLFAYLNFNKDSFYTTSSDIATNLNTLTAKNIPFLPKLKELGLNVRFFSGQKEQSGVFISQNRLTKNVSTMNKDYVERNSHALMDFLDAYPDKKSSTYLLIIPTASGVLQDELPQYSQPINQKNFIDSTYNTFAEYLPTISIYDSLLENRNQYIYYRTEDNLTAIGGYYIYESLSKRMLGEAPPKQNQFDISYASNQYYGNLYDLAPSGSITPDVLMEYRYQGKEAEHVIYQTYKGQRRQYHTLYPQHKLGLKQDMDIYLGGFAQRTDIVSAIPEKRSLLIIGDETALSYVPFLTNSYSLITLLNGKAQNTSINASGYSQILISCSSDTYMNSTFLEDSMLLLHSQ